MDYSVEPDLTQIFPDPSPHNQVMGAFTRSGINHLLPVINVVGKTALAQQKDPTDI